jgi:radical SAM protein with 4Fe4S-binding SPASM domain
VALRISRKVENQFGAFPVKDSNLPRIPCDYVTGMLSVNWDGRILRCCHDFEAVTAWADINTESIDSILGKEERLGQIENHRLGKYTEICEKCNYNTSPAGRIGYVQHNREHQNLLGAGAKS